MLLYSMVSPNIEDFSVWSGPFLSKADKSVILLERHIKARYVSMQNLIISSVNIPVDWLMPLPL